MILPPQCSCVFVHSFVDDIASGIVNKENFDRRIFFPASFLTVQCYTIYTNPSSSDNFDFHTDNCRSFLYFQAEILKF